MDARLFVTRTRLALSAGLFACLIILGSGNEQLRAWGRQLRAWGRTMITA